MMQLLFRLNSISKSFRIGNLHLLKLKLKGAALCVSVTPLKDAANVHGHVNDHGICRSLGLYIRIYLSFVDSRIRSRFFRRIQIPSKKLDWPKSFCNSALQGRSLILKMLIKHTSIFFFFLQNTNRALFII